MITRDQLYLADEVFFTGTAAEVTPIREVDNRKIGDGRPAPSPSASSSATSTWSRGATTSHPEWLTRV